VDNRFPLCVIDTVKASDVEIEVSFTPIAGRIDQAAGLMFRVKDENNYYVARANARENNVNLYHVVGGVRTQIAGVNVPVRVGKTQQFVVVVMAVVRYFDRIHHAQEHASSVDVKNKQCGREKPRRANPDIPAPVNRPEERAALYAQKRRRDTCVEVASFSYDGLDASLLIERRDRDLLP
jgi:hypothetical protein